MFLLRNLKTWFRRLFKKEQPVYNVPSVWVPTAPQQWVTTTASTEPYDDGLDLRFFTEKYKIDFEMKKRLSRLVQYPEFRDLETYFDWRINAAAHRQQAFLLERNDDLAANEAAVIQAIAKIPQDLQNFWTEVKLTDAENEIIMAEEKKKKPKIFGEDAISLEYIDNGAVA